MREFNLDLSSSEIKTQHAFVSNKVKSTKYTFFSFLPISLLNQLANAINDFFIINGILQYIPAISTNDPMVSIVPVAFVIILGMLFEFIQDIKRFFQDRRDNLFLVPRAIIKNGQFQTIMTQS